MTASKGTPGAGEDMGPAASCHLCVGAGGYEDYDGEWVDCSCQLHSSDRTTKEG